MKNLRQFLALTVFLCLSTGCAVVNRQHSTVTPDDSKDAIRLSTNKLIVEILDILYRDYYKEINYEECAKAILRRGITECADCFTHLLDKDEELRFLEPEPGPMENTRLKIEVDSLQKGPIPPELLPQKFVTVLPKKITEEIGYVRVTDFYASTPKEFKIAIDELLADGSRAIIIDLRNNKGGLVSALCEIAYFFEPNPFKPVFYTSRRAEVHRPYMYFISQDRASELGPRGKYENLKVVVLANKNTVSCGELMTAWFKEEFGAPVIGSTTYGKGVIQKCHLLSDGSRLFVPYWEYFVGPHMLKVHGLGVQPTIPVIDSSIQMDEAIKAAKLLLK